MEPLQLFKSNCFKRLVIFLHLQQIRLLSSQINTYYTQTNIFIQQQRRSYIYFYLSSYMSHFGQSPEKEGQNSTHATGHLGMVENLTREADKDLQQYHKLIELFRQQLNGMKTKIENINEQILQTTNPLVESLYRTLELGMINQKEQNNNFQEQLTQLKKEKSVLSQMIVASFKRTDALHEEVGHY